jgi:hypothetical protein
MRSRHTASDSGVSAMLLIKKHCGTQIEPCFQTMVYYLGIALHVNAKI